MRKLVSILLPVFMVFLMASPAVAAVTYTYDYGGAIVTFTYSSPGYVTGDVVGIPCSSSSYAYCSVTLRSDSSFLPSGMDGYDVVQIYVTPSGGPYRNDLYPDGAFLAANTYGSIFYPGTLIVSGSPTSSVPEPGTLALLGLGLAGIVALQRRKH